LGAVAAGLLSDDFVAAGAALATAEGVAEAGLIST
jgi:hypothetical protein